MSVDLLAALNPAVFLCCPWAWADTHCHTGQAGRQTAGRGEETKSPERSGLAPDENCTVTTDRVTHRRGELVSNGDLTHTVSTTVAAAGDVQGTVGVGRDTGLQARKKNPDRKLFLTRENVADKNNECASAAEGCEGLKRGPPA